LGRVAYPGMAQFHPLKFLAEAAKGLNVFENTFVQRIEGGTLFYRRGKNQGAQVCPSPPTFPSSTGAACTL
jgi:hypothetical protein